MKKNLLLSSGSTIYFREAGQGPVLLLLHAFPLDSEMWLPQIDAFAQNYHVIAPDIFGFGDSHHEETWTVDSMANALAEFLVLLNIHQRVVVGGLSMGGYIALGFARKYAHHLQGLILADTRSEADSEEARAARGKSSDFVLEHGSATFFERMMLPKVISDQSRKEQPELANHLLTMASRQKPAGISAGLMALRNRPDVTAELSAIACPTLIICGSEDTLTPPALSQAMADKIPNSTLKVIAGAGHLSNIESPELFNEAVQQFLESCT